jgi:Rad3-related DNA helicase
VLILLRSSAYRRVCCVAIDAVCPPPLSQVYEWANSHEPGHMACNWPPGVGKTECVATAVLAAFRDCGRSQADPRLRRVFFMMRTVAQRRQFAQLLLPLAAAYGVQAVEWSTRKESGTCVHPKVRYAPHGERSMRCQAQQLGAGCSYKDRVEAVLHGEPAPVAGTVADIEELGNMRNACPFYLMRELMATAQVIVGVHQLVMDPVVQGNASDGELQLAAGDLLVLDEAHQVGTLQ